MIKKFFIFLPILVCLISCISCQNNQIPYYNISYVSSEGGTIQGKTEQTIKEGKNASTVIAIPNDGFKFVKWSDGIISAERTDENITNHIFVTALFAKTSKTYKYVYNNATDNVTNKSVYIDEKNIQNIKFVIPKRINSIFEGWYLEKDFKTQVSDANGKTVIDIKLFDSESETLYAKYSLIKDATYKILMVYVTEVEGVFETDTIKESSDENLSESNRYFHYKMSDEELQICNLITRKFKERIDDIFCGLVNFEVEEYFTKRTLNSDSFSKYDSSNGDEYYLYAYNIPELTSSFLENYDSILTTVQLGDTDSEPQLHPESDGTAEEKNGCIFWDQFLRLADSYKIPLESLLSNVPSENCDKYINDIITSYIHEFIHTVEMQANFGFDYHSAMDFMNQSDLSVTYEEAQKLILLNQAPYNEKTVGIPYEFWIDEFYLNVTFTSNKGGQIFGNSNQQIKLGESSETVTAIPDFGYKFKYWAVSGYADGSQMRFYDAELTMPHIKCNHQCIAVFDEIIQDITYAGVIDNKVDAEYLKSDKVYKKDFLKTGLWVPEKDGYKFEGWFLDFEFTLPVGDKNGKVTEKDYIIFEQNESNVALFGKFSKSE